MNKSTSLYLDFLRVIAAFGVLLVHANLSWASSGLFFRQELGHKLVMVFFVLSGFLIAFTVDKKNKGAKQYMIDRFSRLYSVVLPAILFTYLIDFFGKRYNPVFYQEQGLPDHQAVRMFLNLTFLQQIWGLYIKPSTNGPFWSIAYEFWYYMLFAAYCFLKGKKRIICIALICLLIGPKILLLLPVWMYGVLAYCLLEKIIISNYIAITILLVSAAAIFTLTFVWDFSLFSSRFVLVKPPLFFSSNFGFDWLYGLLVAVNIFAFAALAIEFEMPKVVDKIVRHFSSITFSLYLFHFPLFVFIAATIKYNKSSYWQVSLILIAIVFIVNLVAFFTEKQRNNYKILFGKVFGFLFEKIN